MFTKYKSNKKPYINHIEKLSENKKIYRGYVQQTNMYETLQLLITDKLNTEYSNYYDNNQRWYLVKNSSNLKELIQYLWFNFSSHGVSSEYVPIKAYLEDNYLIEIDTIKKMFAGYFPHQNLRNK